jgi:ZIP family zinc transporter
VGARHGREWGRRISGLWLAGERSPRSRGIVLAFAAGAVLTMLADTMMPEAFEHARKVAGLATTLGFVVAFAIAQLE